MVVEYCYLHKVSMPEKVSRTKKDELGNYKVYNSHMDPQGKICFGKGEAPTTVEENVQASKDMVADVKAEQEMEEDLEAEEEPKTDEEKMWRAKEDRAAKREKEKNEQITRLTLAKSFIQAGLDYENAVKNNDLEKWTEWVLKG